MSYAQNAGRYVFPEIVQCFLLRQKVLISACTAGVLRSTVLKKFWKRLRRRRRQEAIAGAEFHAAATPSTLVAAAINAPGPKELSSLAVEGCRPPPWYSSAREGAEAIVEMLLAHGSDQGDGVRRIH